MSAPDQSPGPELQQILRLIGELGQRQLPPAELAERLRLPEVQLAPLLLRGLTEGWLVAEATVCYRLRFPGWTEQAQAHLAEQEGADVH